MKIVADENMPYVEELFSELGEVIRADGRSLTPEMVKDADVLLVRSVTKVNQALLVDNNQLKFVGSATIGTDHIDKDYLEAEQIPFSSAPGCNATSVGEFAFTAMLELAKRYQTQLKGRTVGIVGAGNTGSALAKCLEAYGVSVLLNDPLLEASGDPREFVNLDALLAQSDVISLHVPLTKEGAHKTWYLFDEHRLNNLKLGAWLLNCCRGEVIDNASLVRVKKARPDIKLVLDVWEGEPNPMAELVPLVEFATPHIAGYSLEGKARGTFMLYQALCRELKLKENKSLLSLLPDYPWTELRLTINEAVGFEATPESLVRERLVLQLVRSVYDLRDDDLLFRDSFAKPQGFDFMRKNHKNRREFSALKLVNSEQCELDCLIKLGFSGVGQ